MDEMRATFTEMLRLADKTRNEIAAKGLYHAVILYALQSITQRISDVTGAHYASVQDAVEDLCKRYLQSRANGQETRDVCLDYLSPDTQSEAAVQRTPNLVRLVARAERTLGTSAARRDARAAYECVTNKSLPLDLHTYEIVRLAYTEGCKAVTNRVAATEVDRATARATSQGEIGAQVHAEMRTEIETIRAMVGAKQGESTVSAVARWQRDTIEAIKA